MRDSLALVSDYLCCLITIGIGQSVRGAADLSISNAIVANALAGKGGEAKLIPLGKQLNAFDLESLLGAELLARSFCCMSIVTLACALYFTNMCYKLCA